MRLKRLALLLLVALSVFAPVAIVHATSPVRQVATEKKDCTVYVTRTGNRYHKSYCSSLRKSRIPMSRSQAISAGYSPCKRCGGSDCEQ